MDLTERLNKENEVFKMSEPIYNGNQTEVDIQPQNGKAMAILAYFGILVLIPWLAAKEDRYAQYHAKQGALLCLLSICYSIVTAIINSIMSAIFKPTLVYYIPVPHPVASAVATVLSIASLFFFVLAIIGIVNAAQGKSKPLPIIGGFTFLDKYFKY